MGYKDPDVQREYCKRWVAERRKAWLAEHGPCSCGSWDRLEVHHIDPKKKSSHRVWSWSKEKRDVELSKCRVLCYQCHKNEHRAMEESRRRHGTSTMYRRGCRCAECKEFRRIAMAIYRGSKIPVKSVKMEPFGNYRPAAM